MRLILDISHQLIKRTRHKIIQIRRLFRKTNDFLLLLAGATIVSLVALGFSKLVDYATELNHYWLEHYYFLTALVLIPPGFMLLTFLTMRLAPYTAGSGIPQVMASLIEPSGAKKKLLLRLIPTLLKMPLTFLGLILGASIGREGPTVQLGASIMLAWGEFCNRFHLVRRRFKKNDLLAMGAAGGIAAAFNAPLAGIIFAIEELSRLTTLKWERQIMFGILASGFILIAIEGNNPHFPVFYGSAQNEENLLIWVLICALVCGITGGMFSKLLIKGFGYISPARCKTFFSKHPVLLSGIMGLGVAAIGIYFHGATYGVGYELSKKALLGNMQYVPGLTLGKFAASIFSYWAGLPGGIFTPSLSIGSLIGIGLHNLLSIAPLNTETIVLLCMAAFLAAVTQSPLTASIIVVEMTLSISILFWLLICCILACFVAKQFSPRPFYLSSAIKYFGLLLALEPEQLSNKKRREKVEK